MREHDYFSVLNVLMREYGMTKEYVEGGYALFCKITGEKCHVCRPVDEAATCAKGTLKATGITPVEAVMYMALEAEESMRNLAITAFMKTGELPGKGKVSREKVKKKIENPLAGFPNDVKYPSKQEMYKLRETIEMQSRFAKKPLPAHRFWTQERMDACGGKFGDAVKRASVNDQLWGRYLSYKERGITLTLDHLKEMLDYEETLKRLVSAKDEKAQDMIFQELRI